jgi:hypothetical protein
MQNGKAIKLSFVFIFGACFVFGCSENVPVERDSQNPCLTMVNLDEIFTEVENSFQSFEHSKALKRKRLVKVNFEKLKNELLGSPGKILSLPVFKDKPVNFRVHSMNLSSTKSIVISGSTYENSSDNVTMVINGNSLSAVINIPSENQVIEISSTSGGNHSIQEFEPENENCKEVDVPDSGDSEPPVVGDSEIVPIIDILAVYTPKAKEQRGGTDGIVGLIKMGIADTNKAFADSGIKLGVRLVGTMELESNEGTEMLKDLTDLRTDGDGRWDSVHAERERLGADQVSLIGAYEISDYAGIAYLKATKAYAFSVTMASYFRQYTFSHELGHNIGLNHSDGIENSAGQFRTIMAYGSYPRIPRYSNPDIPFDGFYTGTINNNSAAIANYNAERIASLVAKIIPFPAGFTINSPEQGSGETAPTPAPRQWCS